MLPNHAPLVVAEQFGTLESLFPGRIDLGLGRAPGTDQATARALRRTLASDPEAFPHDVLELMSYFSPAARTDGEGRARRGLNVPIYILGLEPVRRAGCRGARAALRLCVALRAGADDAGDRDLSRPASVPSAEHSTAVPHPRRERRCRGHRRGGTLPGHVRPRGLRQPAPRHADRAAAAEPRNSTGKSCRSDSFRSTRSPPWP